MVNQRLWSSEITLEQKSDILFKLLDKNWFTYNDRLQKHQFL